MRKILENNDWAKEKVASEAKDIESEVVCKGLTTAIFCEAKCKSQMELWGMWEETVWSLLQIILNPPKDPESYQWLTYYAQCCL